MQKQTSALRFPSQEAASSFYFLLFSPYPFFGPLKPSPTPIQETTCHKASCGGFICVDEKDQRREHPVAGLRNEGARGGNRLQIYR